MQAALHIRFHVCDIRSQASGLLLAEHAVLIAGGIGVTPFAAILESLWFRHQLNVISCPKCAAELDLLDIGDADAHTPKGHESPKSHEAPVKTGRSRPRAHCSQLLACVRAFVCACVRARARACVCVCAYVRPG